MDDSLTIAMRFVVESVLLLHLAAVVNFSVVDQSNVGVREKTHRLHASDGVDDLQAVKSQARVRKGGNGLDAERLRPPVSDLVAGCASYLDVLRGAEECPNSTHAERWLAIKTGSYYVDLSGI